MRGIAIKKLDIRSRRDTSAVMISGCDAAATATTGEPERLESLAELKAALRDRKSELAQRDVELVKVRKERDFLRAAYDALKQELELLKRRIFIATAERVDAAQLKLEFQDKLALLNTLADTLEDPKPEEPKPEEQPAAEPSEQPANGGKPDGRKNRKSPPTGRRKLDEIDEAILPIVRVTITDPLFEQLVAEGKAKPIGVEPSSRVGYERGGFRRVVTERVTYAAVNTQGVTELETAPVPAEIIPRCIATADTQAYILNAKYCDGLPLYRVEDIFARLGVPIARGLMSRWVEQLGATFGATIVHAARQEAFSTAFCMATDATGFAIQPGPSDDGKRHPCRRGHYFVLIADRDHIFFEFKAKSLDQNNLINFVVDLADNSSRHERRLVAVRGHSSATC